jgi:hypothetical protein
MKITLSVIETDFGSIGGHVAPLRLPSDDESNA